MASVLTLRNFSSKGARLFSPRLSQRGTIAALHSSSISLEPPSESSAGLREEQTADDWRKNLYGTDNEKLTGKRGDWWWTGQTPTKQTLEFLSNHNTHVSCLPQITLDQITESKMRNYFDNSWLITEVLFSGLQGEEAFYRPPYHNLRHPMIFYYAHPITFYVNKLRVAGLIPKGIDPYFEEIFEVGVDEMRWDDISTVSKDWPSVSEVHGYRQQAYNQITDVISSEFQKSPVQDIKINSPLWALAMGVEHEKIHIETSSVLMRELPISLLRQPEFFPEVHPSGTKASKLSPKVNEDYPENAMVRIPGEEVSLGREEDLPLYAWDNELGSRELNVPDFDCSKMKVSNGEYYEFVKSGGYRNQEYWSEDGWGWRVFRNQKWPAFWVQKGPAGSHEYGLRTIFNEIDMPWSWPVNVNYHEATAFCNWKSKQNSSERPLRMVTEAEHHCLRETSLKLPLTSETLANDDAISKGAFAEVNNHLAYGSEWPVDEATPNSKGVFDSFGNTWDWLEDDFNPFNGFKPHEYYDDFSSPCFDGQHRMILGGSFISCSSAGGNVYSRYHFRPHFHQHAGFRYVRPSKPEPLMPGQGVATFLGERKEFSALEFEGLASTGAESYETERLLDQYVALHFGQGDSNMHSTIIPHENLPKHALNFPARSAQFISKFVGDDRKGRALDLGCAVGGASFQLAREFDSVVGVDFSASFINKAQEIQAVQESEVLKFKVPIQGDALRSDISAVLPSWSSRQKVEFKVGDATKLTEMNLGKFDAILCANLLCRLPDPVALLESLSENLNPEGVVVFLSPYSWLEEFTPKEKWGVQGDKLSDSWLKEEMESRGFKVVGEEDMPLLIREHERKYQYIVSHGLAFQKVA